MAAIANPSSFPQFTSLPAEIQLQIWESTPATLPTAQMHLFEVHIPAARHPRETTTAARLKPRSRQRDPCCANKVRKSSSPQRGRQSCRSSTVTLEACSSSRRDHSGYKFRDALLATCTDAAGAVRRARRAVAPADRAAVRLSSERSVDYDAGRDVLHLRFVKTDGVDGARSSDAQQVEVNECRDDQTTMTMGIKPDQDWWDAHKHEQAQAPGPTKLAPLSAVFRSAWSEELAAALHGARRIAIDVSQIWPELADEQTRLVQDIVFLACTMQHDLEVLYLVDDPTRGESARQLTARGGELYERLHYPSDDSWEREQTREADVIHGTGKAWREVFDLEGLGWHERHPGFVFGEMFGEVVRLQQGNWHGEGQKKTTFQGIRVLVAESE